MGHLRVCSHGAVLRAWSASFFVLGVTKPTRDGEVSVDARDAACCLLHVPSATVDAFVLRGMARLVIDREPLLGAVIAA